MFRWKRKYIFMHILNIYIFLLLFFFQFDLELQTSLNRANRHQ